MSGKFFIVNGQAKTFPPKPPSPPLSSLPAMTVGGWGDPHLYITTSSVDSKKRISTKTIAQVGDNKPGSAGNNELILIDLQTTTDTIKIYYTNKPWQNTTAKIIDTIRVEHNTVSTTYNSTTKVVIGPVTLSIAKIGSGTNSYLNFETTWAKINNVIKLGGVIVPILKRVASSNGKLWNGGDGLSWDGIGKAATVYGLNRSSFETGVGIQSLEEELVLSEKEANFLEVAAENFTQESDALDILQESDGSPVAIWDTTTEAVRELLALSGGLESVADGTYVVNFATNINYIP
jgi:hypothetical protein